jgi:hypothetical protein
MKENSKYQVAQEVEELVRRATAPLDAGYAFGCVVITSTAALTELEEIQLFLGWNPAYEFAGELERQLRAGRIALALGVLVHVGQGNIHCDIHVAEPYCADPDVEDCVHRFLTGQFAPLRAESRTVSHQ